MVADDDYAVECVAYDLSRKRPECLKTVKPHKELLMRLLVAAVPDRLPDAPLAEDDVGVAQQRAAIGLVVGRSRIPVVTQDLAFAGLRQPFQRGVDELEVVR